MNTIDIKGEAYKVKPTLRAMFIFEQISRKPFKIENMLDNYIYFYSLVLANNPDKVISWDTFIDALDEDPTIYEQLNNILLENSKIEEILNPEGEEGDGELKKN